jgi:hypothetical protein
VCICGGCNAGDKTLSLYCTVIFSERPDRFLRDQNAYEIDWCWNLNNCVP